jgi:hypothetical protein
MNTELYWYENYSLNLEINQTKVNDFISKLVNKSDDKNVETKINQIEKDYLNKLKDMEELCKNPESIDSIKQSSSLVILQKELDIIKLITKYTLQNKSLDYDFYINCLNILLSLSETLRNRLGQKEVFNEKIQQVFQENISRCSYKFCSYQDNCSYNYDMKTKNLCYQDHFVHNMVSTDLKILLNYINTKYNSGTSNILHNKEILKTINTLSFVIGHMELELRTKCLYLPENEWESCHVVKNK